MPDGSKVTPPNIVLAGDRCTDSVKKTCLRRNRVAGCIGLSFGHRWEMLILIGVRDLGISITVFTILSYDLLRIRHVLIDENTNN